MEILTFAPPANWPDERFTIRTDVQPDEFNQYADEAAQSQLETEYKNKVKSLELALCELRSALLRRLPQKTIAPKPDKVVVSRVHAAQVAHRKEDRAQAIKWLRQQREVMLYYIDHPHKPARTNREKAVMRLAAIDAEIERLRKLTVSQMLTDRSLTEIDEKRFAVP